MTAKLDFDPYADDKPSGLDFDPYASTTQATPAPAAIERPSSFLRRAVGDTAVDLGKGVVGFGEAAVGLGNLVSGGYVGKGLEAIGYDPQTTKKMLEEGYTHERVTANKAVSDAKGFVGTAKALIQNPSSLIGSAVESAPLMLGGGAVARGGAALLGRAGSIAAPGIGGQLAAIPATTAGRIGLAAAGEGLVGAGSAAEGIRQQSDDGLLSARQTGAALASGAGTAALAALGGKVAQKLGIADIDVALAGGAKAASAAPKNILRRTIEGMVSEGLLEELPQSMQEQMWQNVATDKPLMEGVPEAAAAGALAGGLMGGGFSALSKPDVRPQPAPNAADKSAGTAGQAPAADTSEPLSGVAAPLSGDIPIQPQTPAAQMAANMRMEAQVQRANAKTVLGRAAADATDMQADAVQAADPFDLSDMGATESGAPPVDGFTRLGAIAQSLNLDPDAIVAAARADVGDDPRYSLDGLDDRILTTYAQSLAPTVQPAQAQDGFPSEGAGGSQPTPVQAPSVEAQRGQANPVEDRGLAGAMPAATDVAPAQASVSAAGAQAQEVSTASNAYPQEGAGTRAAAAPAPTNYDESENILDSDITTPSGTPFTIRDAADRAAARHEGGRVFPVDGGFVVRTPVQATADPAPHGSATTRQSQADTAATPPLPSSDTVQAGIATGRPSGMPEDGTAALDQASAQLPQSAGDSRQPQIGTPQAEAGTAQGRASGLPGTPASQSQGAASPSPQDTPVEGGVQVDGLRAQLRSVEDQILRAAPASMGAGGGDIESAMRSRKVPAELKTKRRQLKDALRAATAASAQGGQQEVEGNSDNWIGADKSFVAVAQSDYGPSGATTGAAKAAEAGRLGDTTLEVIRRPNGTEFNRLLVSDGEGGYTAAVVNKERGDTLDKVKAKVMAEIAEGAPGRAWRRVEKGGALPADLQRIYDAVDAAGGRDESWGTARSNDAIAADVAKALNLPNDEALGTHVYNARQRLWNDARKAGDKEASAGFTVGQKVGRFEVAVNYKRRLFTSATVQAVTESEVTLLATMAGKKKDSHTLTIAPGALKSALAEHAKTKTPAPELGADSAQSGQDRAQTGQDPKAARDGLDRIVSKAKAIAYLRKKHGVSARVAEEMFRTIPRGGLKEGTRKGADVAAAVKPGREVITPANDKLLGNTPDGDPLYERADGFRYTMRDGRVRTGGLLFTEAEEAAERAEREATKAEQPALHQDPGEPAEQVTPAVIADAAKTADRAPTVSMAEARKTLLAKIDAAIKAAPNEGVLDNPPTTSVKKQSGKKTWEVDIARTVDGLKVPTLTIVESHDGNNYSIGLGGKMLPVGHKDNTLSREGSLLAARLMAARMQQGATWKAKGKAGAWTFTPSPVAATDMLTLDVPGDGTFKVLNTKERLTAFRKQVEAFFKVPATPKIPGYEPSVNLTASAAQRAKVMAEAETVDESAAVQAEAPKAEQPATPVEAAQPEVSAPATVKESLPAADATPGTKIDDFGQRLEGARKFLPPGLKEAVSDDDLANLPLSKVWPSDAYLEIEDPMTAAMAFTARDEIPAKPRVARKVASWVAQVKMFRGLMQKFNEESMPRLLEIAAEKGFASLLNGFFPRVQLLAQLPRESWKRVEKVGQWPNARRLLTKEELAEKSIVLEIRQDASRYHDYFKVDKATGERTKLNTMGDDGDILWAPNPHSDVTIDGKTHTFPVPAIGPEEVQKVKELLGAALPVQTGLTTKDFEIRTNVITGLTFINRKGDAAYRHLKAFAGTKSETVKEARAYLNANVAELSDQWEAVKARDNVGKGEVRRAENAKRQGPNRRDGKDVTAEMFTNAFGFRGVQFGNWVKQGKGSKDRQGLLNAAYDGLLDLADLLGIPSKAISLEGSLGLALGSQGVGKHAATFFPQDLVINLTKMRGAGSLAHEWFHALDNYFARKRGGEVKFTGNNQHYRENNYITYKPEPLLRSTKGFGEMTKAEVERRRARNPASKAYLPENWERSPSHKEGVRPVVEKAFAELVATLNASPMMQRSADIDGLKIYADGLTAGDAYWSRVIERGARSFETYVIAKLAQRGWTNDFLANIRSLDQWTGLGKNPDRYPYPKPEEEAPIAAAFDKLFGTIESRETDTGIALESVTTSARQDSRPQPQQSTDPNLPNNDAELRIIAREFSQADGMADSDKLGLRKAVNAALGGYPPVNVTYLRGEEGLDGIAKPGYVKRLQDQRASRDSKARTAGLYLRASETVDGKPRVVLFTDVANTPTKAMFTAAHEIAGHHGLRSLLGLKLNTTLARAYQNPTVKAVADAIYASRGIDKNVANGRYTAKEGRLLAIEEALADLAAANRLGRYEEIQSRHGVTVPLTQQKGLKATIARAIEAIKAIFRAKNARFTDAQVHSLLEASWKAAQDRSASFTSLNADGTLEQVVFHGTPHTVDRFSLQKIGTGEGAQAYGWGLYYASLREIADYYRKTLSNRGSIDTAENIARQMFPGQNHGNIGGLIAQAATLDLDARMQQNRNASIRGLDTKQLQEAIDQFKRETSGNLYRVDVPEDSDLLDWDAVNGQPPNVTRALKRLNARLKIFEAHEFIKAPREGGGTVEGPWYSVSGHVLYKELTARLGSARAASEALQSVKIPGLRYLDGNSRSDGKGSANYVIWDESAIGQPQSALESVSDDTRDTYNARIDALFNGDKAALKGVRILDRSDVLGMMGLGEGPMNIAEGKVIEGRYNHKLTAADWKKVPGWLENPALVFQSEQGDGSRLVFIAPETVGGEIVRMIVQPNAKNGADVHLLVNAYDAAGGNPLLRWAQDDLLRYVDTKKSPALAARSGRRLPGLADKPRGSAQTILTQKDLGKYRAEAGQAAVIGTPSSALESTEDQTQSEAFKRWFGDSKVVDADGKPLVVYHGTNKDFSKFKDGPVWFHTDPQQAFASGEGANVMPAYVKIERPIRRSGYFGMEDFSDPARFKFFDKAAGQWVTPDGVIGDNGVVVAFSPKQIKSATGNRGTFDPNEGSILESVEDANDLNTTLGNATGSIRDVKLPAGYLLGDLLGKGQGGALNWWHKSVGTMFNLAKREPLFKRVFDSVQNMVADISHYANAAMGLAPDVLPKFDSIRDAFKKQPMSARDAKKVSNAVFDGTLKWARDRNTGEVVPATELNSGIVWTADELRSRFGMDDKQIGLYQQVRAAIDRSLDDTAVSQMIRHAGEDGNPVREQMLAAANAHAASEILSKHLTAQVKLMEGDNRSKALLETAEQVEQIAKQIDKLKSKGYAPLSRFGRFTVYKDGENPVFLMFETQREANRAARMMREKGDKGIKQGTMSQEQFKLFKGMTPETLELFGEMLGLDKTGSEKDDLVYQSFLKAAKSNRSALKRLIHRQGIEGYSEDVSRVLASFLYSNARLAATNLHAPETQRAINEIPKEQGDLKDTAIKLNEYIVNPDDAGAFLSSFNFAQYLGGSIASAMVNMTQPLTMSFPWLSQYGGAWNAAKALGEAVKLVGKGGDTGNLLLDEALKRADADGHTQPQEVHQLQAYADGRGVLRSGDGTKAGDAAAKAYNAKARIMLAWGLPFSLAEQFNRRATFIAAFNMATEQGMADPYGFAVNAVQTTQGIYNKANKPAWARNAIGGLAFTFKTYSINYVEMLHRMWTKGGPQGKKGVLLAVATMFLLAGAGGLPGADDLDDLIDGLMQRLGYNFSSKQEREAFFANLIGEQGAAFMEHGLSSIPGMPVDVSGRLGMGNLIPSTGLFVRKADHSRDIAEIAGPTGDFIKRSSEAFDQLTEGNLGASMLAIAPRAAANVWKGIEMAETGEYRDTRGRKVLETTTGEAIAKGIGFQPASVAKVQQASGAVMDLMSNYRIVSASIADRWAKGIYEQDPGEVLLAQKELADWNAKNPDMPIRIGRNALRSRVRNLAMDRRERLSKSTPKAVRAQVEAMFDARTGRNRAPVEDTE